MSFDDKLFACNTCAGFLSEPLADLGLVCYFLDSRRLQRARNCTCNW